MANLNEYKTVSVRYLRSSKNHTQFFEAAPGDYKEDDTFFVAQEDKKNKTLYKVTGLGKEYHDYDDEKEIENGDFSLSEYDEKMSALPWINRVYLESVKDENGKNIKIIK